MFKKTILALAAAAALVGFGSFVQSTPAEAQTWRHGQVQRHAPVQRNWQPNRVQRNWQPNRVQHTWRAPRGQHSWRGYSGPRHYPRYGYYGGYWGYAPVYGSALYIYPPGVYGEYCRYVKRHVRVHTDRGWRWRWRTYRICS